MMNAVTQDALRYKQDIEKLDSNTSHIQILYMTPDDAKILDVGCACGDLGAYLFRHKRCTVYGLEYNTESIAAAKETGAYAHIEQVDLNILDVMPSSFPQEFDRIIFGDVLEHLNEPERVLEKFLPYLGKNGRVIISLPNIAHGSIVAQLMANKFTYMDYGVLDRTHLRFFTRESIASVTAALGLKILSATRTIWNLPGLHPYIPEHMLPQPVVAHISANPHAYVLQYVFEAIPSDNADKVLEQHNLRRLDSFSEEEKERIASFRGGEASSGAGHTPSWGRLPFSQKIRCFLPYAKPWLKRHMPRPLWDFLKDAYKSGGSAWHRVLSMRRERMQRRCADHLPRCPLDANASADFVALTDASPPSIPPDCPRPIAFYLPQFHPFPENDAWWGRGFTEWTNVTGATPQFVGHYQPHLPIDLGFYDLRVPEVMKRQVELAKKYGIHGFCFHYYWFSGKRLMERPLFDFLERKELSMPFCLCWANEPWSRRWDGSEDELLIRQDLRPEDDARFIDDLLPFLGDERYIAIGGRPVLIIYRPHFWRKNRVLDLVKAMRLEAGRHGFSGLYLIAALSHDFSDDPRDWGFDAGMEFPPHLCGGVPRARNVRLFNPDFRGSVHDMRALVDAEEYMRPSAFTTFKTVFPSWDNTARKANDALVFHHSGPDVYAGWLNNALRYTHAHNGPDEQFVFINAWNEWAEGAHLEPDRKYGYAFLQATADVLSAFEPEKTKQAAAK
jgi:2-polyprenyl-3-methyl-5-hydroxy-6-metoxy-1,4-benzoquinol methylase